MKFKAGPDLEVQFKAQKISLAITADGITENGWAITPLNPSVVRLRPCTAFRLVPRAWLPSHARGRGALGRSYTTFTMIILYIIQITKQQVDGFRPGQRIPSCQFQAEWIAEESPVKWSYKVTLEGAEEPFNFLTISCPPTVIGISH